MPAIATLSSAQAAPPVPTPVISAEDNYTNLMKLQPQVPLDTPKVPLVLSPANLYAASIHPETGLKYSTTPPKVYGNALVKFGFNVDKLNSIADQYNSFTDIPQAQKDINFPTKWKLLKPAQQEQAYNTFLEDRQVSEKTGKTLNVPAKVLQAQSFYESGIFTNQSGTNNYGGVKLNKATRKALGSLDYSLKPGTSIDLENPVGKVSGATLVKTNEGLKATTPEEAILEAKKRYPEQWQSRQTDGQPTLYNDNKTGRFGVKIVDYFANYKNLTDAGDAKINLLTNLIGQKK